MDCVCSMWVECVHVYSLRVLCVRICSVSMWVVCGTDVSNSLGVTEIVNDDKICHKGC